MNKIYIGAIYIDSTDLKKGVKEKRLWEIKFLKGDLHFCLWQIKIYI